MTRFDFADVVLVVFAQPDGSAKQRPALVVLDVGDDDVVLAPITSRERKSKGDYRIEEWKQAGLLVPSWVRLAKVTCLSKRDLRRKLGGLSANDKDKATSLWKGLF